MHHGVAAEVLIPFLFLLSAAQDRRLSAVDRAHTKIDAIDMFAADSFVVGGRNGYEPSFLLSTQNVNAP